jgi:hypothetical protein
MPGETPLARVSAVAFLRGEAMKPAQEYSPRIDRWLLHLMRSTGKNVVQAATPGGIVPL